MNSPVKWYTGLVSEEYIRKPNTKCKVCLKPIYRRPSVLQVNGQNVFCSQVCYGISCRKEIVCPVCSKKFLAGLNKKTCSRECANKNRAGMGYKMGRQRKDKVKTFRLLKQRLMEQRGPSCEICKYDKIPILQIHHIDRNRQNNDLSNLRLLCPNCHYEAHLL